MALAPLVAMLATAWFWFDTRYMHRTISDTRFIELQIRIVQGDIRDHNKMLDAGVTLSAEQRMQFDLDKDQLKFLMSERNKILGIGGLPE